MLYHLSQTEIDEAVNRAVTRITCLQLEASEAEAAGDFDLAGKLNRTSVLLMQTVETLRNAALTDEQAFNLVQLLYSEGRLEKAREIYDYTCTGGEVSDVDIALPLDHNDPGHIINTGAYTHLEIDQHIDDRNNPHQVSLSQLTDTSPGTPEAGQGLVWDGTSWVARTVGADARNGLGTDNGFVELGGPLTRDTVIGTGGHLLEFASGNGDASFFIQDRELELFSRHIRSGSEEEASLQLDRGRIRIEHNYEDSTGFYEVRLSMDNGLATFRDRRPLTRGLEYEGDYEDGFQPRTLVTRQYVDARTFNEGSGLERNASDASRVDLGGDITLNTVFRTGSHHVRYERADDPSYIQFWPYRYEHLIVNGVAGQYVRHNRDANSFFVQAGAWSDSAQVPDNTFSFQRNQIIVATRNGTGIRYAGDYSLTFTDRSLIDLGYHRAHITGKQATISLRNAGLPQAGQFIQWDGTAFTLAAAGGGGEGANLGGATAQASVFAGRTGGTLQFRTLSEGTGITIETNETENIVISAWVPSSTGTGQPLFYEAGGAYNFRNVRTEGGRLSLGAPADGALVIQDNLGAGTGLSFQGDDIVLDHLGLQWLGPQAQDRIFFWDASHGNAHWLEVAGPALSITGRQLTAASSDRLWNAASIGGIPVNAAIDLGNTASLTPGQFLRLIDAGGGTWEWVLADAATDGGATYTAGEGIDITSDVISLADVATAGTTAGPASVTVNAKGQVTGRTSWTAANGISFGTAQIRLGGTLDADTAINGADNFFNIAGASSINLGTQGARVSINNTVAVQDVSNNGTLLDVGPTGVTVNRDTVINAQANSAGLSVRDDGLEDLLLTDPVNSIVRLGPHSSAPTGLPAGTTVWISGSLYATGNIVAFSDERDKEGLRDITGALDIVRAMKGRYYNRKGSDRREVGFMAQELWKVLPEAVRKGEGTWGVTYGQITAVLVEAIKELYELVNKEQI